MRVTRLVAAHVQSRDLLRESVFCFLSQTAEYTERPREEAIKERDIAKNAAGME